MPAWPSNLPWEPNNGEYEETPPDNLIRFKTDFGPDVVRRRGIAGVRIIKLPYRFSPEQTEIFDDFLHNDLKDGALPFTFNWPPPPRTTKQVSVRIKSIPTFKHRGAGYHDVTVELEVLP